MKNIAASKRASKSEPEWDGDVIPLEPPPGFWDEDREAACSLKEARASLALHIRDHQEARHWRDLGESLRAYCEAQAQALDDHAPLVGHADELTRLQHALHRRRHTDGTVKADMYARLWALCAIDSGRKWLEQSAPEFCELTLEEQRAAVRGADGMKARLARRMTMRARQDGTLGASEEITKEQVPWSRREGALVVEIIARQIRVNSQHVPELRSITESQWIDPLLRWREDNQPSSRRAFYDFVGQANLGILDSPENLFRGLKDAARKAGLGLGPLRIEPHR